MTKPKRKARRKPDRKTPVETPLRPGPRGGLLRTGNPGNAGGGRSPNWLVDKCDELLADPASWAAVEKIAKNPRHPAFATMWKALCDRAHGRPRQSVDVRIAEPTLEDILTAVAARGKHEGGKHEA